MLHPVSYSFTIGEENWIFEVTPENGWRNTTLIAIIIGFFTFYPLTFIWTYTDVVSIERE